MKSAEAVDVIPRPSVDALPWEKLSVALVDILGGVRQVVTVDELQRAETALDDSYRGLSSFERFAQAAANVLVAQGRPLERNPVNSPGAGNRCIPPRRRRRRFCAPHC